jgi:membrane protein
MSPAASDRRDGVRMQRTPARPDVPTRVLNRLDEVQRRHRWLGFGYAVVRKYLDDDGSREAALLTYYGFLSLFPVLLLGVGAVSLVLAGHPDQREQVVAAIVPPTLLPGVQNAVDTMPTGYAPLVAGVIGLVLSGVGVVLSAHRTLNHVAAVPFARRVGIARRYVRAVAALAVVLAAAVSAGTLTIAAGHLSAPAWLSWFGSWAGAWAVTCTALCTVTRLLLERPAPLRQLWPAAVPGAVAATLALRLGASVMPRLARRAGLVYGAFAVAAAAFTLLYLLSVVLVATAEAAAVRTGRLWPRALDPGRPTDADVRARALLVRELERTAGERVDYRPPGPP